MTLKIIDNKNKVTSEEGIWYLIPTTWSDYGYKDTFTLYYEDYYLGDIKVFYKGKIQNNDLHNEIKKQIEEEKELYFIPVDILVHSNIGYIMSENDKDVHWYKQSLKKNRFFDILYFEDKFKEIKNYIDEDLLNKSILRQDNIQHLQATLNLLKLKSIYKDPQNFSISDFLISDLFDKNIGKRMFTEKNLSIFDQAVYDLIDYDRAEYYKTIGRFLGKSSNYKIVNEKIIPFLMKWFDNAEDDDDLKACLGNVINKNIRELVHQIDKIKSSLAVSANQIPSDALGQYTSANNLKFLINRSSENIPCLRLTNSNQMNDPLEGKVLQHFLIGKDMESNELDYVKSNSYVSSATATIDSLPMWKQYGDNTKGLCLIYNNEYLNRLLDNQKTNMKLYRIAYFDGNNLMVAHFKEEKVKEISDNVQKALNEIRSIVKGLKKGKDPKFYKIGMIIINSIAYLFKSLDYAYENEFRILMTVNKLKERNVEVNIVDNKYMLHVYTVDKNENKIPVEYSTVILGPEAEDIDYIGPYVKLCSEKIHINKSKIHFR